MNLTAIANSQSRSERNRLKNECRKMLARYEFTHFVSLAMNAPNTSSRRALRLLREWDARQSRALVGPKWQKRPDERPVWFAFLESPRLNPHWHLMLDASAPLRPDGSEKWSSVDYARQADHAWTRIVPSGTIDVQLVTSADVNAYVTKSLDNPECYENFVTSLEFIR